MSVEKNQIHREALFTSNQSSTEGPGRKLNPPKAQATSGIIPIRFQDETNYVTMAAWQDLVVRI